MSRRLGSALRIVGLLGLLVATAVSAEVRNREAPPGSPPAPDMAKDGGPDCAGATGIGSVVPDLDTGNSCGAPAVVSDYRNATCNAVSYPGPELIYQITLTNQNVFIELSPTKADMGLFLVSDCTAPTSCVDFHDAIGAGVPSQVPRLQTGEFPPGTYYVYVDSYYAEGPLSCGDYRLDVSGIPVELMRFTID